MNAALQHLHAPNAGQIAHASAHKAAPRSFTASLHHDLSSVEPIWRMLERDGRSTPFQRYDWAKLIAKHLLAPSDSLLVVEVKDAASGQALMLMPLLMSRKTGYSEIEWLNGGVCDYSAPLLADDVDWTPESARAAWQAVRAVLPPADLICIDGIPATVEGLDNPMAMLSRVDVSALPTFGMAIDGDPATVLERCCPPTFMRDYSRKKRKLEKVGRPEFVEATTPQEVDELFAVAQAQRAERFRKMGRFDLMAQPKVAAFYREAAMQGLRGGAGRIFALKVGDEFPATLYGLKHGTVFQVLLPTMAGGAWTNCSPGMLMLAGVVEWARGEGVDYFDMSVGDLAYKRDIGGRQDRLYRLTEALTLRGQAVLRVRETALKGRRWLKEHPQLFERLRATMQSVRRLKGRLMGAVPGGELAALLPVLT